MSKTPRIGDKFTYDGRLYKVDEVLDFSTVSGKNIDPEFKEPYYVKAPIREIELI